MQRLDKITAPDGQHEIAVSATHRCLAVIVGIHTVRTAGSGGCA
jgi:hypothetical protein